MKKRFLIANIVFLSVLWVLIAAVVIVAFSWTAVDHYVIRWMGWGDLSEKKTEGTINYITPHFSSKEDAYVFSREVAINVQAEGTVLLENDGALPLRRDERRISVFGTGSVNISYGGTGSGEGNGGEGVVDLYAALGAENFIANPTLKEFYKVQYKKGYRRGLGTDMNGGFGGKKGRRDYGYSVNEIERSKYSPLRASYSEYSDAAIIVISRSGGEGQDLPTDMSDFYEGDTKHYLELTDEERDLLKEVRDGGFKKIIVLLNTLNAFELGFLKDPQYAVDAALWIGGTGQYGLTAVAQILTGKRSPEGRLPDTYASNLLSAPAMANYGDNRYTENGKPTTAAFVAYSEGIYIGYRYYETRFFDVSVGADNAGDFDYLEEVVYPFGYGLGYTDFEWSTPEIVVDGDKITVTVEVKNTGTRAGREVVQLYAQKPYTAHDAEIGLEKSAIELVGFAKSETVSPEGSYTVGIELDKSRLASYDAYEKKTYRMDAGKYLLTVAKDAHSAVENILERNAFVAEYEQIEDGVFAESKTGYPVTNRFETQTYTSLPEDMNVLSRSDWQNTWPAVYGDGGVAGKAVKAMTARIKSDILNRGADSHLGRNDDNVDYIYNTQTRTVETVKIGEAVTDSGKGINFIDVVDGDGKVADYYDPIWTDLVQCMSKDELYVLLSFGSGQSVLVESINKRLSVTSDSPMGLHCGTLFPCYPIQAATWNTEIAADVGAAVAEEALWNDIRGWYAPACNTHRTPFGGRNYEYYSEDGLLAGKYAASVVRATQAGGLFVQIKHFALNDQDTNRGDRGNLKNRDPYNGLCTYANEQTIREIYLEVFRIAVEEGGAHGVMTSYNRIGNTWAGGHYGLVTEVLRNEWGMKGNAITDYAGTFGYEYMDMNQGLRAGNNVWLHPSAAFPVRDRTSDAAIYYMQKAAKNILYAEACSSRINNQRFADGSSVRVRKEVSAWIKYASVAFAAFTALAGAGIALSAVELRKHSQSLKKL